jgi:hypothetical protein
MDVASPPGYSLGKHSPMQDVIDLAVNQNDHLRMIITVTTRALSGSNHQPAVRPSGAIPVRATKRPLVEERHFTDRLLPPRSPLYLLIRSNKPSITFRAPDP